MKHKKEDAKIIKAVIKLQLIVAIIALVIVSVIYASAIKSVLFGSLVAVLNSGFLYWRMRKAESGTIKTAEASLKLLYRSGIERFVLTACLLAIGMMAALKLSPLIMLISFIIGQLVFLLGVVVTRTSENNIK